MDEDSQMPASFLCWEARSYYPLFCTLAQIEQVFDVYHEPADVYNSNGAQASIMACLAEIRRALPWVKIEARMENAFFSDAIVSALDEKAIEFTISVPFERFVELKKQVQGWSRWRILDATWSFFECG
jgi:hypothetical protein